MKTRSITGLLFVIVMVASMLLGAYIFASFYVLLSLFCLTEFLSLIKKASIKPQKTWAYLAAVIIFSAIILPHFVSFNPKWSFLLIPVLLGFFIAELYQKSKHPFNNIAFSFLSVIYAVLPFVAFFSIAFISGAYNFHLALGFFMMLWANDTGAYLFGIKFGKHRLFERHSPKKSWEGFFGGIFTSVLVAYIISHFYQDYALIHWIIMALIISCFGTLGDLVESMFKRSIDVKDSGSILPGHGGLLDRFDGLLLSAPLVFVYLYLITY